MFEKNLITKTAITLSALWIRQVNDIFTIQKLSSEQSTMDSTKQNEFEACVCALLKQWFFLMQLLINMNIGAP